MISLWSCHRCPCRGCAGINGSSSAHCASVRSWRRSRSSSTTSSQTDPTREIYRTRPRSAWALEQGLSGPWSGPAAVARRVRVFAAQQRLAGWLTYGRLLEAAQWVQEWQVHPPVDSGLPDGTEPAGPDDADEPEQPEHVDAAGSALARRLEKVADGYERRHYRLFGYPGTAREWAEELAEPLVAS